MNAIPLPEALENIFPEVQDDIFLFILTLLFNFCLLFGTGPGFRAPEKRGRVYQHVFLHLYTINFLLLI